MVLLDMPAMEVQVLHLTLLALALFMLVEVEVGRQRGD
jgi:hypothetical protein